MKNLVGNLLIAPPSVKGSFWQKSVVLLTEQHIKGSVGIVLNKPSKVSISEFAKQNNSVIDLPGVIYIGGPVNAKALTLLHTSEWSCSNTMQISEELSISSSPDILTMMAMGHIPKRWRMFVGLCGWTKDQLQNELDGIPPYNKNQSWLTTSSNLDLVFEKNTQSQWAESIELAGSEFVQKWLA